MDIRRLDEYEDWDEDESLLVERFIDELLDEFADAPEGDELLATADGFGYWIRAFVEYGYRYENFTLPTMDVEDTRYVVEQLLPRKITIAMPEDADEAIPELIVFWTYLGRAYELPNAQAIVRYLRGVSTGDFRLIMLDPTRAGMSKSLLMQGVEAGYDMSDPDQINKFFHLYGSQQLAELQTQSAGDESGLFALSQSKSSASRSQHNRKKMAKASRKKNRKPKKKKKRK